MSELENIIREIAEPFVESLGLEIWGIEISQFHKTVIRIYVDSLNLACNGLDQHENCDDLLEQNVDLIEKEEESPSDLSESTIPLSVSVDKCARISRHIAVILEVEDIIPTAYVLEVSSPGFSRQFFKLSQLHAYLGDSMEVVLRQGHEEWENRRKFSGTLEKVTDTAICMRLIDADKPKKVRKNKDIVSAVEDNPAQTVLLEWDDIRIIKKMHIFNQTNIVKKKKKSES